MHKRPTGVGGGGGGERERESACACYCTHYAPASTCLMVVLRTLARLNNGVHSRSQSFET